MAQPRLDIPGSFLSLRPGHQRAPHLLWRHRRSIPERYSHQGQQLYGCFSQGGNRCVRQTGTLTHGEFAVAAVHADDFCLDHSSHDADNVHIGEYSDKEKILLHLAAHAEHFTTHPIGAALRTAFPQEATDGCEVTDVEEIAGQGIRAK